MPHTTGAMLDAVGQTILPEGIRLQARGGLSWIAQDSTAAYQRWYQDNTALDLRYELRVSKSFGNAEIASGIVGRRELRRSPEWDCGQRGAHCRSPAEAQVTAGYHFRRYAPAVQLELPMTEALRNSVKWILRVGVRATLDYHDPH